MWISIIIYKLNIVRLMVFCGDEVHFLGQYEKCRLMICQQIWRLCYVQKYWFRAFKKEQVLLDLNKYILVFKFFFRYLGIFFIHLNDSLPYRIKNKNKESITNNYNIIFHYKDVSDLPFMHLKMPMCIIQCFSITNRCLVFYLFGIMVCGCVQFKGYTTVKYILFTFYNNFLIVMVFILYSTL